VKVVSARLSSVASPAFKRMARTNLNIYAKSAIAIKAGVRAVEWLKKPRPLALAKPVAVLNTAIGAIH